MLIDDVIYYTSLLMCVSIGSYYKKIDDVELKRSYGAGLGMLVACSICGQQIYHSILLVWGNLIIIKCCDKRYVHQISMGYTWMYLVYMHFNVETTMYVIWLHQTIALRLVGLAFEMNTSEKYKLDQKNLAQKSTTKVSMGEADLICIEPSSSDIITYAFFFIGLHKGPYYRWKIFNDHFNSTFSVLGDCSVITAQKLKKALICALGYFLLRMKYSTEMYYKEAFYKSYDMDYRYLYNVPLLLMYFLQQQVVTMLCTSVCTETGFGVYPAKCLPQPGHGPTARHSLLKLAAGASEVALQQEYNFSMLKCFDNAKLLLGPKMKDTMRGWDMSTQYWFWTNVYKNTIKSKKEVRSACSFLAWTIWCGLALPQLIISTTLWVYVHLESEYAELYDTNSSMRLTFDIGYSIMRILCLIYLTPCFVIDDSTIIIKYYSSLVWIYHLVLLGLILTALLVNR